MVETLVDSRLPKDHQDIIVKSVSNYFDDRSTKEFVVTKNNILTMQFYHSHKKRMLIEKIKEEKNIKLFFDDFIFFFRKNIYNYKIVQNVFLENDSNQNGVFHLKLLTYDTLETSWEFSLFFFPEKVNVVLKQKLLE